MQQVVVKVAGARLLKLLIEDLVAALKTVEEAVVQLGRQGKTLARITINQGLLGDALAGKAVIHPRGVKIGEALGHEQVDHLLDLLNIHRGAVVWVELRHAHKAEAELLCGLEFHGESSPRIDAIPHLKVYDD